LGYGTTAGDAIAVPLVFLVLVLGGLSGDHGDFAAAIDLTAVTVLNALKAN
jgi:hypothetical protein